MLRNDFPSLLANHAVRLEETSDAPKERFVIPAMQQLTERNGNILLLSKNQIGG